MGKQIFFKYSKLVVFDEETALDMLDQNNEGRLQYLEKTSKAKGASLFSGIFSNISNNSQADAFIKTYGSMKFDKQIEKQITNTIKNDFIMKIESQITGDFNLEHIKDYNLYILNGTSTYYKTISPITKIIKDFTKLDGGKDFDNIEFNKFEELIDDMKSYHELIAYKTNSAKIIRVNPRHLQNNYKISDLRKMKIDIVGVKIGQSSINDIMFESLINTDDNNLQDEINKSTFEERIDEFGKGPFTPTLNNSEKTNSQAKEINFDYSKPIDIIDVIIAGVK